MSRLDTLLQRSPPAEEPGGLPCAPALRPRGTDIPEVIRPICIANADTQLIESQWDRLVHLTASVHTGQTSAVAALARFGLAASGDPIYEAGVQLADFSARSFSPITS